MSSPLAYEEIRVTRPTTKWACLWTLYRFPTPGQTARRICGLINNHPILDRKVVQKNVESRLCELVRLKLVQADDQSDPRFMCYWITRRGIQTIESGENAMTIIRKLNNRLSSLDTQRAAALGPFKQGWTDYIERELGRESDILFNLPPLLT